MIAASGFLSLFSLKSPFFLFLFCIIDHMLADFEKERNFFVVTSLQSQHSTGFITTQLLLLGLAFSSFLIQELNSNTYS